MPNVSEKKLKLLYLMQMLLEKTDGQHSLTLPQMLRELEARGIPAERKSLYDDLETLRRFGLPIETRKTRNFEYFVEHRPFSPNDLMLLTEAVRSAPFLSQEEGERLVRQLRPFCSQYQWEAFQEWEGRREPAAGFGASPAEPPVGEEMAGELPVESRLDQAMEQNRQVKLRMLRWKLTSSGKAKLVPRVVTASPWRWRQAGEASCLVAFFPENQEVRTVPLEEISQVEVLDFPREGERSVPPVEKLVLEFPVSAFGRVAAFFAGSLSAEPAGKGKVRASVHTAWDDALQAWLFSEGPEVRLVAPKKAAEQFRERAKALAKAYKS